METPWLIAVGLVALQPFTEWVTHVYLLHSMPIRFRGRRYDLPAAREHRDHNEAPAEPPPSQRPKR